MEWIVRVAVVVCVSGCGPQVIVPGDDEGGEASEGTPPAGTTGGSVPPSVTIGTAPMPVTTTDPYDPTTGGGPFYPDWGLPGATTGGCLPWPSYACAELPGPNAFVGGDTPLGTFDTDFAVFGTEQFCDQCVETPNVNRIVFVPDPAALPDGDPGESIELEFFAYEGPDNEMIDAMVTVIRDGMAVTEWGTAQIYGLPDAQDLADPYDPAAAAVITGGFAVDAPGWTLFGNFDAPYCPALNTFAICE